MVNLIMEPPDERVDLAPPGTQPEKRSWQILGSPLGRLSVAVACVILTLIVGYLDYLTGYEQSLLLFYLVPIAIATWFGGLILGLLFSVFSVVIWVVSDIWAGISGVGFWNLSMALSAYVVFTVLLAKLRSLLNELEDRVRERTKELRREVAERKRLDREIANVADRERHRLGQELHDSLCQHLTGTALTAQSLRDRLAGRSAPEVPEAEKVIDYIEQGIDLSRDLARGFFAPELDAEGLAFALRSLAENMAERFNIPCVFHGEESVRVPDSTSATQLYRIAQEAVMNAIKHAQARSIRIGLVKNNGTIVLKVEDDGVGLPVRLPEPQGLGLRLMSHGAGLLGADFNVSRNPAGGTSVTCKVPIHNELE
ncbi:MAG TPA: sensor histidine kinase [Chthoniobacterales bacterium]|jgi:signal transduction histidine kinase